MFVVCWSLFVWCLLIGVALCTFFADLCLMNAAVVCCLLSCFVVCCLLVLVVCCSLLFVVGCCLLVVAVFDVA